MIVVDDYSTAGISSYDATGGGPNPIIYTGGGTCSIVTGPGPASGTVANTVRFILADTNMTYLGNLPDYKAFARGKLYIHNNREEAVVLNTNISHDGGTNSKGWNGTLKAYTAAGTLVGTFPVVK